MLVRSIARSLSTLIFALVLMPLLAIVYFEGSKVIGLRPIPVFVAGTGSMYPSLYWSKSEDGPEDPQVSLIPEYRTSPHLFRRFPGIVIFGKTYGESPLGHGDMVAFRNSKTSQILESEGKDPETGFIKRIIALPGDTLELRDGFVYLNNELLSEPYLASARSTFGGPTLSDCQRLTIPSDSYFVMGDNRKISSDSRFELGLIHTQDVTYYLPYSSQSVYHSLYRDTAQDSQLLGHPTLDAREFLESINQLRASHSLPPLKNNVKLARSADFQAQQLLSHPDEPLKLSTTTSRAGYSNIVLGEFISRGYFNSIELRANLLAYPKSSAQILNSTYQDLGLGIANGLINGCPGQVIVGHLGGYVPPQYDQAMRSSWEQLEANLVSVIPSWQQATNYPNLDQAKLQELLSLLNTRLTLARDVLIHIREQRWFPPELESRIKADQQVSARAEQLTEELNRE